jgi:hypothetical protein
MLTDPARTWYLSELACHLHVSPSNYQCKLARLAETGILRKEWDDNRVYYPANLESPLTCDLRSIILDTVGLCDDDVGALGPLARQIKAAFIQWIHRP